MQKLSITEENYIKAIYTLSHEDEGRNKVSNLSISERLHINPATVTDMLRKLSEKNLIDYNRIKGAALTEEGRAIALSVVRKHRLWETFLVEKLNFFWDEVHEVAEQLEHINSEKLITSIEQFLDFPRFDPHGDPIPDAEGRLPQTLSKPLSDIGHKGHYVLCNVGNDSAPFLQLLDKMNLKIGDTIEVMDFYEFDGSFAVKINEKNNASFSHDVAKNLYVREM